MLTSCTTSENQLQEPTAQTSTPPLSTNASVSQLAIQPSEIKRRLAELMPYCFDSLAGKPIDADPLVVAGYSRRSDRSIGDFYVEDIQRAGTFQKQISYALYPDYRKKCIIATPHDNNDLRSYRAGLLLVLAENGYAIAGKPGGRDTINIEKDGIQIQLWIKHDTNNASTGLEFSRI